MKRVPLTFARKLNAAGLALFGLSIPLQIGMGITTYPTIPPGLLMAVGAAALIVFGRWRWTIYLGLGLPLALLIGIILAHWLPRLLDPSSTGYAGVVLQMAGLAMALVGGAVAVVRANRRG